MKTIGLIGGTTWLSTMEYYRIINQKINEKLGGVNSGRIIIYSVNFAEFNVYAKTRDWKTMAAYLISITHKLENAGAECLVICANTPHIAADDIEKEINLPLIHIAGETAKILNSKNIRKAGLLGTKFTMEENFFKRKLMNFGIETIIPDSADREFIHNSIFDELGRNIFKPQTKSAYLNIIKKLADQGAQGIILGCTEIPLLIKQGDLPAESKIYIPLFDTTLIHANAVVDFATGND